MRLQWHSRTDSRPREVREKAHAAIQSPSSAPIPLGWQPANKSTPNLRREKRTHVSVHVSKIFFPTVQLGNMWAFNSSGNLAVLQEASDRGDQPLAIPTSMDSMDISWTNFASCVSLAALALWLSNFTPGHHNQLAKSLASAYSTIHADGVCDASSQQMEYAWPAHPGRGSRGLFACTPRPRLHGSQLCSKRGVTRQR